MGNGYRNPSATRPARGLKRDRDNEDKIERWEEQELDINLGEQELRKRFLADQGVVAGGEAEGNRSNIALSKSSFSAADPNVVSRFKESTRAINPNSFSAPSQGSLKDRWSAPDASGRRTFSSGSIVGNVFGEGGRLMRPGMEVLPVEGMKEKFATFQKIGAGEALLQQAGAQAVAALGSAGSIQGEAPWVTSSPASVLDESRFQPGVNYFSSPKKDKPFWELG